MLPSDRRLYLLFTPSLCAADPWHTLAEAMRGGVDLVQWRKKEPDRTGFETCRALCRAARVPLIVNDDVMLAVQGRAQGAHVGQADMPAGAARRILAGLWLGVSTHDRAQIEGAVAAGADYIGFGPCFPTSTKGYAEGVGPAAIEAAVAAAAAAGVPLFAIGGITSANLLSLRVLGVDRIAVSAAILQAADPRAAAAELHRLL
jgi:thiamine-phosphate pyrophosphorylase